MTLATRESVEAAPVGQPRGLVERLGLDGPQTLFNGRLFWAVVLAALAGLLSYPLYGTAFMATNFMSFMINVPLALGLSLLWGYGGTLSFGQMAFYGVAGYSYGIVAINLGGGAYTFPSAVVALLATVAVAWLFGYFVFYGRVSGWIVPVLTLVLTLILETFLGQTAGYGWKVGEALLGGYNGMTGIPSLHLLGMEFHGFGFALFYLVVLLSFAVYVAMRMLVNSHFGHVVVAIREDYERTELMGYDVRFYQLVVFTIAAALAGLSGILYVSWGNYITPSAVGLLAATMPVLWVAVGGKSALTAVFLSTLVIEYINDALSVYSGEFAFVLLGLILVLGMMFAPSGVVISLVDLFRRFAPRRRAAP